MKRINEFDWAVPDFGDGFLFWDESAGATRRADPQAFAPLMAGQGLTANAGKINLGGAVPVYTDLLAEYGSAVDIHSDNYEGYIFFQSSETSSSIDLYSSNPLNSSEASLKVQFDNAILNARNATYSATVKVDAGQILLDTVFCALGIDIDGLILNFTTIAAPAGSSAYIPVKLNGVDYALELKSLV